MDSIFDALIAKSLAGGSGGGGGGGTDNYNALSNKPKINGTTLTGDKSLSDLGIAAASDIPTVNNGTLTIQKNGATVNTFKANQASDVTVNITVPTTASDVSALPSNTKYAASLSLTIDSSTYIVTGQLKDQDGNNIGSAQTIDLPLETMVVSGSYDDNNKKIILTLKNGDTIDIPVADLVAGLQSELSTENPLNPAFIDYNSTYASVSESDKTAWSGKQDALVVGTNLDNSPTQDSTNPITSGGVYTALTDKVAKASSSTSGNIVTFNNATGDGISDSGKSIETTLSSSDNTKIPTSKAVADYVGNVYPKLTYVTEDNNTYIAIDYGS